MKYKMEISNEKLEGDLCVNTKNHILEVFYKQIFNPNYLSGYIAELLRIDTEKISWNNGMIVYLEYKLSKDLEYEEIEERLKIGI